MTTSDTKNPLIKQARIIHYQIHQMINELEYRHQQNENSKSVYRKNLLEDSLHYMRKNANVLLAKLTSAQQIDSYCYKMESAWLVRKAIRELKNDIKSLELSGFAIKNQSKVLSLEIESFKRLFAPWVKTIQPKTGEQDEWGFI